MYLSHSCCFLVDKHRVESFRSWFHQLYCLSAKDVNTNRQEEICWGENKTSRDNTREGKLDLNVENIKLHRMYPSQSKPLESNSLLVHIKVCSSGVCHHICIHTWTDPKITACSAECERPVWRTDSKLVSGAQGRGHLPQEHMGQPGFDEMGGQRPLGSVARSAGAEVKLWLRRHL